VKLTVYNILGQQIRTLVDREVAAGPQTANWNGMDDAGRAVATGVYFYRLSAGDTVESKKMILLK
jgi:flagellar hook assembly protein FlgD